MGGSWEETHDQSQEEERDGSKVDRNPKSTKVEDAVEERLIAQATQGDAADGDEIGGQQSRDAQG